MNALLTLLLITAGEPPAVMVPKLQGPPAVMVPQRRVVAAKPFRSGDYHAGHVCPNCGRTQLLISTGSKYGPHTHTCPACRTVWNH